LYTPLGSGRAKAKRAIVISAAGLTAVASIAIGLAQAPSANAASGYLSRSGAQLMLNGKPYTYLSFNAYGMTGQETGTPYSRSVLDGYFSALPTKSLTRTWAWKNNGMSGIDNVVASATANNQMVIFSLSEGAGYDHLGKKDEAWFANGYKSDLLPWVRQVVTKYKDSQAVGMWEIMNEPGNKSAINGTVSNTTMKSFFDTVAGEIKAIDKNHLVTTGTMDANQHGMSDFGNLHAGSNIDVASIHEYADEYEGGILVSNNYTQGVAKLRAAGVNKPVILGEVGVPGADNAGCRSRAERVNVVQRKADAYLAAGASGINLWNWFPANHNQCVAGQSIYPGDPLIGFVRSYKGVSQNTGGPVATVPPSSVPTTAKPPASSSTSQKPSSSSTSQKPSTSVTAAPGIPVVPVTPPSGGGSATFDDNNAAIAYTGTWKVAHEAGKFGGSDHYTYANGAKASMTFSGNKVQIYSAKASHHGTADVLIDGKKVGSINQFSWQRLDNQLVFASATLGTGNHTLTIVNTTPVNSNPWDGVIALDRIVVTK
jgi:mannan endo-1,4-beta-mannosidase